MEETSDLTGNVWTASASYLRAGGGCSSQIISMSGSVQHADLSGLTSLTTDMSGNILTSNVIDEFSVTRYTSGTPSALANCIVILDEQIASVHDFYLSLFQKNPPCQCGCGGKNCKCPPRIPPRPKPPKYASRVPWDPRKKPLPKDISGCTGLSNGQDPTDQIRDSFTALHYGVQVNTLKEMISLVGTRTIDVSRVVI